MGHAVSGLKNFNITYIYQLGQLLSDLLQNAVISTADDRHAGKGGICGHTNSQTVNIVSASGEKTGNSAKNTGRVIY